MSMLRSERSRAERSGRRLVLMLVDSESLIRPEDSISTEEIQTAICCATRETDIKGWYQDGAVIGVIFTEIPISATSDVEMLSRKVNQALYSQLGAKVAELRLSFHVSSERSERNADGLPHLANVLTFYPDPVIETEPGLKSLHTTA